MNINKFPKFNKFQPFNKSTQLDAPNIKQGELPRLDLTKGIDNSKPQINQCQQDLGTKPKDDLHWFKTLQDKNAQVGDTYTDENGKKWTITAINRRSDGSIGSVWAEAKL